MNEIEMFRDRIDRRLGDPPVLRFPERWTMSTSWYRAQSEDSIIGPLNPLEWDIILGSGSCHRVEFFVFDGHIRACCSCDGYRFSDWCAHIAHLWWRWVRHDLVVVDLDTGANYTAPPWWLSVYDADVLDHAAGSSPQTARTDGGLPSRAETARARESPTATYGGCHTHSDFRGESHDCDGSTGFDRSNTEADQ